MLSLLKLVESLQQNTSGWRHIVCLREVKNIDDNPQHNNSNADPFRGPVSYLLNGAIVKASSKRRRNVEWVNTTHGVFHISLYEISWIYTMQCNVKLFSLSISTTFASLKFIKDWYIFAWTDSQNVSWMHQGFAQEGGQFRWSENELWGPGLERLKPAVDNQTCVWPPSASGCQPRIHVLKTPKTLSNCNVINKRSRHQPWKKHKPMMSALIGLIKSKQLCTDFCLAHGLSDKGIKSTERKNRGMGHILVTLVHLAGKTNVLFKSQGETLWIVSSKRL